MLAEGSEAFGNCRYDQDFFPEVHLDGNVRRIHALQALQATMGAFELRLWNRANAVNPQGCVR